MVERWRRVTAVGSVLGASLSVVSRLPPAWYGSRPTDSYVFDPALFSPLWVERVLMPMLALVGTIGLIGGLVALVSRDWGSNRLQTVGGALSVLGAISVVAGLYGPELVAPANTPVGPVSGLAGFALSAWGGLLLLLGGPLLAYSYIRAARGRLGWTLLGFVPAGVILDYLFLGGFGDVVSTAPVIVLGVAIAWDLEFRRALPAADTDP